MSVNDSESEQDNAVEVLNVSDENNEAVETIDEVEIDQGEIAEPQNDDFMADRQTDEDYSKYSERIFDFSPRPKKQATKLLIKEINVDDGLGTTSKSNVENENQESLVECEFLERAEEKPCEIMIEEDQGTFLVKEMEKLLIEEIDDVDNSVAVSESKEGLEENDNEDVGNKDIVDNYERQEKIEHKPCEVGITEVNIGEIPEKQMQKFLVEEAVNKEMTNEIKESSGDDLEKQEKLEHVSCKAVVEETTEIRLAKKDVCENFDKAVSGKESLQPLTEVIQDYYTETTDDIIGDYDGIKATTDKNILSEIDYDVNINQAREILEVNAIQEEIVSEQELAVQIHENSTKNEHVTHKQIYEALEEDIKKLCVIQTAEYTSTKTTEYQYKTVSDKSEETLIDLHTNRRDSSDESDSSSSDSDGEKPFYRKLDKGEVTEYKKTTAEEDVAELKELLEWDINKYNYKRDAIHPFKKAPKEAADDEMYALLTNKKQKLEYELTEPAEVQSDTDVIMYARKNYKRYARDEDLPSITEPQIHRALKMSKNITVIDGNNEVTMAERDFEESAECNSIIASNSLSEARQSIREFSRNLAEFTNRYKAQYAELIQSYNDNCNEYTRKVNAECERDYQESLRNLRKYVGENRGEKGLNDRETRTEVLESIACVTECYNKSQEKLEGTLTDKEEYKESDEFLRVKEKENIGEMINESVEDEKRVTTCTLEMQLAQDD